MKIKFILASIVACFLITGFSTAVKADEVNQANQVTNQQKQDNPDSTTSTSDSTNSEQSSSSAAGWKTSNGNTIYIKNGTPVKGLQKIDNNWYLFDKNGVRLKGAQKIPSTKYYSYFDNSGKRRNQNTSTKKAYYWINKKGQITGIKNNAHAICQLPEMPTGCEITAVTMMLNFSGKKVSKTQAAKVMPRSSNPNKGFVGSPYKKFPLGFWVAPGGVKPVVQHYLGKAQIMTNCKIDSIKQKLLQSHLVVVWVGLFDGISNHAITLTGFHGNTLYYNDPWTGTKRKISLAKFKIHWALDGHRAISY